MNGSVLSRGCNCCKNRTITQSNTGHWAGGHWLAGGQWHLPEQNVQHDISSLSGGKKAEQTCFFYEHLTHSSFLHSFCTYFLMQSCFWIRPPSLTRLLDVLVNLWHLLGKWGGKKTKSSWVSSILEQVSERQTPHEMLFRCLKLSRNILAPFPHKREREPVFVLLSKGNWQVKCEFLCQRETATTFSCWWNIRQPRQGLVISDKKGNVVLDNCQGWISTCCRSRL